MFSSIRRITSVNSNLSRNISIATTAKMSSTAAAGAAATAKSDPSSYIFNHTMFRIKDPKVSLPWYKEVLGMEVIHESPGGDFTNYFLAHPSGFAPGATAADKAGLRTAREGVLELCHNWGTEDDASFKGYASGNGEDGTSRGFGHICMAVDDLQAACRRFDELGVKFKKRPEEGRMRHIAFIYDCDGYWVEIIEKNPKA